jgi:hypothetical protein
MRSSSPVSAVDRRKYQTGQAGKDFQIIRAGIVTGRIQPSPGVLDRGQKLGVQALLRAVLDEHHVPAPVRSGIRNRIILLPCPNASAILNPRYGGSNNALWSESH